MNNYKLYINGQLADLNETDTILFNKQRTDYTNPTVVKNAFTKTVKLPETKANRKIFSEIWKLDQRYWTGAFNPSKRVPFILLNNNNLVEKGYVKLDKIVWDGSYHTFEITLYGELGNVLYALSYYEDEDTGEQIKMTLGDLTYDLSSFTINKDTIEDAWDRLMWSGSGTSIYDTLNWCVSYDGVPDCTTFDAKKVWCCTTDRPGVKWKDTWQTTFPTSYTEDSVTYTHQPSSATDKYGLFEMPREVTPLETRDFRSYLLRPVIKLSKIFDAISDYIDTKMGYTLDLSDAFFSTEDYTKTWVTLSMLYEIDKDVKSGDTWTMSKLLSNTGTPASYLISFCKIYGIYIDIDYITKKMTLTRMPNFFVDEIEELKIDRSREIKITPLSFDKASYTFDFDEGEGENWDKYKDTYSLQYGSKQVNTGYYFDNSTSPYIDNNIYREAIDTLEQSPYFRYPVVGSYNYPQALTNVSGNPTYKLFNVDSTTGAVTGTTESEMNTFEFYYNVYGYEFLDLFAEYGKDWIGLRPGVWQDAFPKLQLHSDDNKGADGKNILVRYDGEEVLTYGQYTKYTTGKDTWSQTDLVMYIISDDNPDLFDLIGTNCYYDNFDPDDTTTYITTCLQLPSFVRNKYSYNRPCKYLVKDDWTGVMTPSSSATSTSASVEKVTVATNVSTGRQYVYDDTTFTAGHTYFLAAVISTPNGAVISSGNPYDAPDLIGGTTVIIDQKTVQPTTSKQIIGSIVTAATRATSITPLSTYDVASQVRYNVYYLVAYDLTYYGLADTITTVDDAISYFGLTTTTVGHFWEMKQCNSFSIPREIYIPATIISQDTAIYERFWARYIADVYDVNTRVMECYCYLDNLDDIFHKFYYYDNCYWILSKVTDWNYENRQCKGTFTKVNSRNNYLN